MVSLTPIKQKVSNPLLFFAGIFLVIALYFQITSPLFFAKEKTEARVLIEIEKLSKTIDLTSTNINIVKLTDELIQKLKNENQLQAEIYKDAKPGDYVVISSDLMVIYNPNENKLSYDNLTPTALYNQNIEIYARQIRSLLVQEGKVLENETIENPILTFVSETNISTIIEIDKTFYKDLTTGDIIANYSNKNLITVYRPSTQKLVKTGSLKTSFN